MGGHKGRSAGNVAVLGHVKGDVAMGLEWVGVRLGRESGGDVFQAAARSFQPRGGHARERTR